MPSASVTASARDSAAPCLAAPTIAKVPPGASLAFSTAAVAALATASAVPWPSV
jgi:hypothetical protein